MKTNVGKKERLIRLAAGMALVFLGAVWAGIMVVVGVAVMVTAVIGWCPFSTLLGFDTAGREDTPVAPDTSGPRADPFEWKRRLK